MFTSKTYHIILNSFFWCLRLSEYPSQTSCFFLSWPNYSSQASWLRSFLNMSVKKQDKAGFCFSTSLLDLLLTHPQTVIQASFQQVLRLANHTVVAMLRRRRKKKQESARTSDLPIALCAVPPSHSHFCRFRQSWIPFTERNVNRSHQEMRTQSGKELQKKKKEKRKREK